MEGNPLPALASFPSLALGIHAFSRPYVKERPVVEGNPFRSCSFAVVVASANAGASGNIGRPPLVLAH